MNTLPPTDDLYMIAVCDEPGRLKFTLPNGDVRYGYCPPYIFVGTKIYILLPSPQTQDC